MTGVVVVEAASTTVPSSSVSSSSTTSGGGQGIPEFTTQLNLVLLASFVVVASYQVARRMNTEK